MYLKACPGSTRLRVGLEQIRVSVLGIRPAVILKESQRRRNLFSLPLEARSFSRWSSFKMTPARSHHLILKP
jgi:hypothetical protein